MSGVRRSLLISFAEKYSNLVLNILSTVILARILTPRDIGIYTIASGLAGIVAMLRDFGVNNYLIQERELTESRFQSALGVTAISAALVGVAFAALGQPVAAFYGQPEMRFAIYALALNFLFIPFNAVTLTMLRREMNFAAIYRVSVAGTLANVVTGIALALLGAGFMCMAYGSLASAMVTSIMSIKQRPRQFRLGLRLSEWRRTASFGVFATVTHMISELSLRAPDFIIGRIFGMEGLGLFSRAGGLVTMVNVSLSQPIMSVMLSAFSAASREGADIRQRYLHALASLSAVVWPCYVFLAIMASPVIRILYGKQWTGAVPVAHIICFGGPFVVLTALQVALFQAVGAVRRNLAVTALVTPMQILLLLVAGRYGLRTMAGVSVLTSSLSFVIAQHFLNRVLGLSMVSVLPIMARSMVITVVSSLPAAFIWHSNGDAGERIFSSLAIATPATLIFWMMAIFMTQHPLRAEILRLVPRNRCSR